MIATVIPILIAFFGGLAIGVTLSMKASTARHYQNLGEARVSNAIATRFKTPDYHLLNHLTLSFEGSTTQVDHVLVSRFGVFVIETKDYSGWIFADASHANWTQVLFNSKFKFQNPLLQNRRHVRAVRALLDFLPTDAIQPAVIFVGEAEFKSSIPPGVYDLSGFIAHVSENTEQVMSQNRMQFCVGGLETARLALSELTDVEHVRNLERLGLKRPVG